MRVGPCQNQLIARAKILLLHHFFLRLTQTVATKFTVRQMDICACIKMYLSLPEGGES